MKTSKALLERKRPLFFMAGLVFAFSITLVSFEWRTPYEYPVAEPPSEYTGEEPIWIPVTLPEPNIKVERPGLPKPDPITTNFVIKEDVIDVDEPTDEPFISDETIDIPKSGTKTPELDVLDDIPVSYAAVMPAFCKGEKAMFKFLRDELEYPEIPRSNGVSGTVHIQFVVGKDGTVRDVKVMKPIDPWLDAEALRVAKMLDCFTPGRQAGRNVDVYFILPVRFSLGD